MAGAVALSAPSTARALSTPTATLTGALAKGDPLPNTESLRSYGLWGEDLVGVRVAPVHSAGKVPILSLKNAIKGGTWRGPTWAQMCAGAGEDYLRPQLAAIGALDYPVWLTFDHEPDVIVKNDPSGTATIASYACAFGRIQALAAELGVTNVKWYSALLVPAYRDGSAEQFYAGVALDAAGLDLYMYGPLDSGDAACQPSRIVEAERYAAARGIPLALPEWGVSANAMTDAERAACIERWATWHGGWAGSPFLIYFSTPINAGPLNTRIRTTAENAAAYAAYTNVTRDSTPPADTTPPTVTVRAPGAASTVSATVAVTADVADDTGVSRVTLHVDGTPSGQDANPPYGPASIPWNSTTVPDGPHTLRIVATDAAGNASTGGSVDVIVSNDGDVSPPTPPRTLTAGATGQRSVHLDWEAADDDVGVTGYRISRNGDVQATVTATTYDDTALSPDTTYSYSVVALDAAGNASEAAVATATTEAEPAPVPVPTGLAASAVTSTAVTLSWDPAGPTVTGYLLYRDGAQIAAPSGTSYRDTGLTSGTTYGYTVAAVGTGGRLSERSPAVSVTTAPPAPPTTPTGLRTTSVTFSTIGLAWTASSAERGVAGYRVFRGGTQIAEVTGTSYTDGGRSGGTTYSYSVEAFDTAGSASGRSAALSVTTPRPELTAPTGLTASAVSYTSAAIRWTANSADQGVTGYRVYRDGTLVASPTGTTYSDTALRPATSYSYTVSASNSGASSPQSTALRITTRADDLAPAVPGNVRATATASYLITVAWSASQDAGGSTVAGYRVYRSDRGASPIATVGATATSYGDMLVSAGTRYTYRVAAFDPIGNASAQSAAVTATTAAAQERSAPAAPTSLRVTATTSSTLTLAWAASRDNVAVKGYHVYRNGSYVGTSTTTSFRDAGLAARTTYRYNVVAFDASANRSAASATLRATSGR